MTVFLALLAAAQPQVAPAPVPPFIQAERSFAARAQTEGQWTAFRAFAAPDAIMLTPKPINAHQFLARFRADPPVPVMWWPGKAWVSCDGSLAVTTGPWVRKGGVEVGTFTTVWQRQADGGWKWVYDNGRSIPRAVEPLEVPPVHRAACPGEPADATPSQGIWLQRDGRMPGEWDYPLVPVPSQPPVATGRSLDGTLRWEVHHSPEWGPDAYTFQLLQQTGGGTQLVVVEGHGYTVPPPSDGKEGDAEQRLQPLPAMPSPYLPAPRSASEPPLPAIARPTPVRP